MGKTITLPFDASIMNPAHELVGKIALKCLDEVLADCKERHEDLLPALRRGIYGRLYELEMKAQESGRAMNGLVLELPNDGDD